MRSQGRVCPLDRVAAAKVKNSGSQGLQGNIFCSVNWG